jgi:hypothetical protein
MTPEDVQRIQCGRVMDAEDLAGYKVIRRCEVTPEYGFHVWLPGAPACECGRQGSQSPTEPLQGEKDPQG